MVLTVTHLRVIDFKYNKVLLTSKINDWEKAISYWDISI